MDSLFDIHNHILPGVDDGSSCIEESLMLIDKEYNQGVRNLVLTPHYRPEMFEVSTEDREEAFRELLSAVKEKYQDLNLYLGCEVYLSKASINKLINPTNRMLGKNIVLAEFNYSVSFSEMLELIDSVQKLGNRVVIAHVERYNCLRGSMNNIEILRSMNCLMQVNCSAVTGKDGFMTRSFVDGLFKAECVDFVASDAHDIKRRKVTIIKAYNRVKRKFGEDMAQKVFTSNARQLFVERGID